EVIGFIGPNGAGKSTVIKMMTGILRQTAGKLTVIGFDPFEDRQEYVQNIGVVFGQKSQLWWDIPPADTFQLLKRIYKIPEEEFKERLEYMIELLDIERIAKTPVRNLSLGERMRCEILVSLLHNPKVVFLDEPTIGLDVVAKDKIREFIKLVNKRYGTTFIITTHDMDDIEELCKRVVIIDKGVIMYDGLLSRIKEKYVDSKQIEVVFETKTSKKPKRKGVEIVSWTPYRTTIKVPSTKGSVSKTVFYLMRNFPVEDLTIKEPKIESIIKKMYEGG
ncbi:MAG TPA: ATP-binding cassette domain-containing protein, partial [Candidatus Woesearchaeota archaeon]|nr:ATP-binding cassette domain-containing protein [Candidatus Woesearchaeota archaeon]